MSEAKVYTDELTGIVSKNTMKRADKQDPDIRGRSKVGGIWYWVSGWKKEGANGPFYSLSYTEMSAADAKKYDDKTAARNQQQSRPAQQHQPQQQSAPSNEPPMDFDDDIPFWGQRDHKENDNIWEKTTQRVD